MKQARTGFLQTSLYDCKFDWPEDCFVQAGGDGIVFQEQTMNEAFDNAITGQAPAIDLKKKHYRTAFFEAFPRDPDTFLRGEGASIEEAEQQAWKKYQKITACKHEFFKRGKYTSGAGLCCQCNLFLTKAFEPSTLCAVCGKPTNFCQDNATKEHYCAEHESHNTSKFYLEMKESIIRMTSVNGKTYIPEEDRYWEAEDWVRKQEAPAQ